MKQTKMNAGTVVTFNGRNPISNKTYIGVVVCEDTDNAENVLIAQGALALTEADNPDWPIVSRSVSELTPISMYPRK